MYDSIYHMKRTTIFVPEPLERDLQLYARGERKPVAFVVREALVEYLAARRPASALPSFVGAGRSGRSDIAERHEELLWTAPHGAADDAKAPDEVKAPSAPADRRRPARKRRA
jgi:hypothetical protein